MRKTKAFFILFLILIISIIPFGHSNAHSVELDPESLISMPIMILGGSGTISIKSTVSNYTLYFQAVEIPSTVYSQIEKTESDGKKDLDTLKKSYTALKTEVDNLKTIFNEASEAYQAGITNQVGAEELETLKTAFETSRSNYQSKSKEYNDKITEYNNKINEINDKIKELTPTYIESNWTKTTDNKFSVDVTKFSGEQPYVIWAKLVTSSGTYYDESIYKMTGTKEKEISIKSITLNATSFSIKEGDNYTLTARINPSNATNKTLIWKSDNEKVATVSNGKVNGVSEGTATITVITEDGNHTATCKVTVTKKTNSNTLPEEPYKKPQDPTVKTGSLPNTGVSYTIVLVILIIGIAGIVLYKKFRYLNF